MLDIKYIRENKEKVQQNCQNRLVDIDINQLLKLDEEKRKLQIIVDELRSKRNTGSKTKPTPEQIEEMKKIGEEVRVLEEKQTPLENELRTMLMRVPNMTHPDVHVSDNEDDNPVVGNFGEAAKFTFTPKDHVELAEQLDLIDFDRATKVSGAKFYYLKNELAFLEFALIQYALEVVTKHGFTPIITPDLAKKEVLEGLGFNPRGESTQVYNIENSDLCLIGTAEITMGGMHMDELFKEENLPKKYVAVSHCFRTEAGAYSKFSKGIFRVHQFTKIEMFQYVTPDKGETAHKELLSIEREIFEGLNIPFRVVDHCTADLGGPAIRTFDLEAWMPGKPNKNGEMGDWAEITSTSNCTDYQARGLNIKFKNKEGKSEFVHMLNGTAIAITRALIAILENYQQADGTVIIPEKLRKYIPGNLEIIKKK
ncbi:serine--tRNA ligase [Candidatus Parcubacteria bacterium]|nr:serine--tRNA ligase [Patescibacteria group bacterium]MBU4309050.1 serine--tRNA ligase [Patescibacteria group bacterium]MBU4431926.1 serine--tRNA ligase [Patescibacteria group bacterium]MBU4577411.1 serine--tRNA ligase [Patescibacteria group bacterium]MCG2697099.1 serine--tRNA ligase [Candidatus Parcubacteria bacterium]